MKSRADERLQPLEIAAQNRPKITFNWEVQPSGHLGFPFNRINPPTDAGQHNLSEGAPHISWLFLFNCSDALRSRSQSELAMDDTLSCWDDWAVPQPKNDQHQLSLRLKKHAFKVSHNVFFYAHHRDNRNYGRLSKLNIQSDVTICIVHITVSNRSEPMSQTSTKGQ